jgi:hypothetical protein
MEKIKPICFYCNVIPTLGKREDKSFKVSKKGLQEKYKRTLLAVFSV